MSYNALLGRLAWCLPAGLVLAALPARGQQAPVEPAVALTHVTVIDGTGAPPATDMTVLVRGERIAAVYRSGSRALPKGATTEDLTGKYLIPGLMDAHVHITGGYAGMSAYAPLLRGLLLDGVTGLRDMAGDARVLGYLAREAALDTLASPNIYYSALMAGPTFFYEDPRVPGASEGVLLGSAPWMRAVDATTDLPAVVTAAKATGATGVKLYANLPAELVGAIAKEAERQGMLVWTHATVFPAQPADAVAAGATTLSHTPYLVWQAEPHVPVDYRSRALADFTQVAPNDPRILALLREMKDRGTILDATLRVFHEESEHSPDAMGPGIMPWSYAVTREAHAVGVLIDAGTDSRGLPTDSSGPDAAAGPTVVDEMVLLVEQCGFSPVEAIQAATQVNAMTVGQAAQRGTIGPGKMADLVVLSADPANDVRNVRRVVEVYKAGRAYRP
jgi:imidazolonepropionase-like amidohydrolase